MTKKHFEAIAKVLSKYHATPLYESDYSDYRTAAHIVADLADYFEKDNPKFQREKFLHACGIECDGKHKSVQDIVTCKDCAQALDKM